MTRLTGYEAIGYSVVTGSKLKKYEYATKKVKEISLKEAKKIVENTDFLLYIDVK